VHPGFGGQKFIASQLEKVRALRARLDASGSWADLEIDGGIDARTAALAAEAGARVFVAGNAVFSRPDTAEAIRGIRDSALRGAANAGPA